MDKIAVCAIFKDEAPYLLEWLAFHRMIGVDLFVLYDNGSSRMAHHPDVHQHTGERSDPCRNRDMIRQSGGPGAVAVRLQISRNAFAISSRNCASSASSRQGVR